MCGFSTKSVNVCRGMLGCSSGSQALILFSYQSLSSKEDQNRVQPCEVRYDSAREVKMNS